MDNDDQNLDLNPEVWGAIFGSPLPPEQQPVIGFRICKIVWSGTNDQGAAGPRLHGIGVGGEYKWLQGENLAMCTKSGETRRDLNGNYITMSHEAPQEHCSCGLHACTDLTTLDTVVHGLKSYADKNHVIVGVLGTGEVVIHEKGWRAQCAKVVAICDAFPGKVIKNASGEVIKILSKKIATPDTLAQLSAYYNSPVVGLRSLEAVVREHGGQV